MKYLFILFFFGFIHSGIAQNEIVIPDNYYEKESFFKIMDRIIRNELSSFNFYSEYGDSITENKMKEFPLKYYSDTSVELVLGNITVIIEAGKFDSSKHKFIYEKGTKFLFTIDGKLLWGTDGNIPRREISTLVLTMDEREISIPDSAYNDLYEPNFCWIAKNPFGLTCYTHSYQSTDLRRIYIDMINSDGAGAYEVTWIFQDEKYYGRVVDLLD